MYFGAVSGNLSVVVPGQNAPRAVFGKAYPSFFQARWIAGSSPAMTLGDATVGARPSGLTMRQRAGGFCADPEQAPRRGARSGHLHQFKTTARIAPSR
jgi:hypothetical protein